jgi:hypothetical protein
MDTNTPTVVLPCPPDQFRDFIAGLLGRAQTIESVVEGPFEINKDGVENLFHLIEQRIGSQNEATLVQFTTRVIYDDRSSVLHNSLQGFLSYNEVKPLVAVGLVLSWTYLIKFQNKSFPEKQAIVISLDTTGRSFSLHGASAVQIAYRETSPIKLRIEHTDRSWGADMEALLRGQLEMLRRPIGKARMFANTFSGWIGGLAATVALILTLIASYRISAEFALNQVEKLNVAIKDAAPSDVVSRKVSFLVDLVAAGIWTRFTLFAAVLLIALLIGSVVLGVLVSEKAHVELPSFLLLTNRSAQNREREIARLNNSWYVLLGSFLGAMALGVASNGIFYLALKYLGLPS